MVRPVVGSALKRVVPRGRRRRSGPRGRMSRFRVRERGQRSRAPGHGARNRLGRPTLAPRRKVARRRAVAPRTRRAVSRSRSTSRTSTPSLANVIANEEPASPPPTTSTSKLGLWPTTTSLGRPDHLMTRVRQTVIAWSPVAARRTVRPLGSLRTCRRASRGASISTRSRQSKPPSQHSMPGRCRSRWHTVEPMANSTDWIVAMSDARFSHPTNEPWIGDTNNRRPSKK